MGRTAFNAKERVKVINLFRIAMNGKPFSKQQLIDMFKNGRITTHPSFISEFCQSGIVTKLSNGNYIFTSKEPVYYGELARAYRKYQQKFQKWSQNRKTRNQVITETQNQVPTLDSNQALTEFAINFLKNLGYKILKPETFKEI